MAVTRYVKKRDSNLINNELAPQFLGLWAKMYADGTDPGTAKRALAIALFKTTSYLKETKYLSQDDEFLKMLKEIMAILEKYDANGMHYGKLSAGLEYLITLVLGTKSYEKEDSK